MSKTKEDRKKYRIHSLERKGLLASLMFHTALACAGGEDAIVKEVKERLYMHWTKGRVPLW